MAKLKPMKSGPSKPKPNKQAVQFVRDHVVHKLVRAGWSEDRAQAQVDLVSDEDIGNLLPVEKVQGVSSWLVFVKENLPAIKSAVDQVFEIVSLFVNSTSDTVKGTKPDEETEETEDEDEEEDDE